MAAIYEPRRIANLPPQRPALRLVTAQGGRSAIVPVELGLRTVHLVVAVVALVVVLVGSLAIGNGTLAGLAPAPAGASGGTGASSAPASVDRVDVQAGDTLWTIARRIQPTGDVRGLVDQLVALNGTAPLQPGASVAIPA